MVSQREQWREIAGTDGMYEVSDRGRVRSWHHTRTGKIMKTVLNRYGFEALTLRINGVRKIHPVHKLVAEAFLGDRPEGARIRHLNGDRADNRLENLRYGSAVECTYDRMRRQALDQALELARAELLKYPTCPKGHPRNAENAYDHDGEYKCRTCTLEDLARWRNQKPVHDPGPQRPVRDGTEPHRPTYVSRRASVGARSA